jgi:hypothetical protein
VWKELGDPYIGQHSAGSQGKLILLQTWSDGKGEIERI